MLNITIIASGTRGDVQPYVALGQGLRAAGYSVRLLSSDDFADMTQRAGLEFASMGASIEAMLASDDWRAVTESGNFLKIVMRMNQAMKERAEDMAARLPRLCADS
jgi:sterol 3beta-glucosyltransferase